MDISLQISDKNNFKKLTLRYHSLLSKDSAAPPCDRRLLFYDDILQSRSGIMSELSCDTPHSAEEGLHRA